MKINLNILMIGFTLNFLLLYFGYGIWFKMITKDIQKKDDKFFKTNIDLQTLEDSRKFDKIVIKNSLLIRKFMLGIALVFSIILLIFN